MEQVKRKVAPISEELDPKEEFGDPIETMKAYIREKFDGELPNGLQCSIYRTDPHWCRGYQETVDADDSFSIESIKQRNGGGRYQLKYLDSGGRYITSRKVQIDGPPKREGVELDDPQEIARQERAQKNLAGNQNNNTDLLATVLKNNNQSDMFMAILKMQEMSQAQMQNQMQTNLALIEKIFSKTAVAAPNPIGDMLQYFGLFEQLKGASTEGENSEFSTILNKALEVLGERKKQENSAPPFIGAEYLAGASLPGGQVQGPQLPAQDNPGHPGQPEGEYEEYDEPGGGDESNATESMEFDPEQMDDDQVVAAVCHLFENADEQKRQILMQKFIESATVNDLGAKFGGHPGDNTDTDN